MPATEPARRHIRSAPGAAGAANRLGFGTAILAALVPLIPLASPRPAQAPAVFARDNLVAWCVVPFDTKKRTPAQRVEMLRKLGFKKYAYDWRAEHLPTFDEEVGLLQKAGIELTAVWFPAALNEDAKKLLAVVTKHGVKPQLWVTTGDPAGKTQQEKVAAAAKSIRPVAKEAAKLGCSVALYNHGGWFGEPENQLAVIDALKLKNVGIVYNLHHGSRADVCDGKWHAVAMQYEADRVRLLVDGKEVADEPVKRAKTANADGGTAFARLVEGGIGCDGELDRVRISKGVVEPATKELTADDRTLGLWTFTGRDKPAADSSKLKNDATPAGVNTPASFAVPPGPHLAPADASCKVTLIDRSPADAYVAVKIDPAGRLFVGGREKVFAFDPDGKGGFGPRRELLRFPPDSIIAGLEFRGDDLVRSQAAHYLGWLRDPRTEPAVARVRLELRTRGLADRPAVPVKEAWRIGRFADAGAGVTVERGPIDLGGSVGKLVWEKVTASEKALPLPEGKGTAYLYFRVQSRERQAALLGGVAAGRVWHNGSPVNPESDGSLLLDLQPGSNDILVRTTAPGSLALGVRARGAVSVASNYSCPTPRAGW